MDDKRSEHRYENSKQVVRTWIAAATEGIGNAQEARIQAKESLITFKEQKGAELEKASKQFALLQRVEFIIGAVVLVQIAIFMLKGEPYLVPLIYSTAFSILIYVIVAFSDSRAKSDKLNLESQLLAAKRVKLKNDDEGIIVEFE